MIQHRSNILLKLMDKTPDKVLKTIAVLMVCMMVGPEVFFGMELMALVNTLGADAFLMLVFSSFYSLSIVPLIDKLKAFEKDSSFHVPSWQQHTSHPGYWLYLLPGRSIGMLCCFGIAGLSISTLIINLYPMVT